MLPIKTNFNHLFNLFLCWPLFAYVDVLAASDAYEPNNTQKDAYPVLVYDREKIYGFEYSGDEDWFVFYAKRGTPYEIKIPGTSVGKDINPVIQVFNADGATETGAFDIGFAGEGELASIPKFSKDGLYYVKVSNKEKQFGIDNHYALSIYIPHGPDNLLLKGSVIDQCTNAGIRDALVSVSTVSNNTTSLFDEKATFSNGFYSFPLRPGSYSVNVSADGYNAQKQAFARENIGIDELVINNIPFSMQPTKGCGNSPIQAANPSDAVAVYNEQTGQLSISDVRIGGDQILAAELQIDSQGRFKLTRVNNLAKPISLIPAFYNYDTNRADIGRVYAFQQLYAIQLQNIGDNIFVIDGTPRLIVK